MATTFTQTATYSNLTRLELESLRKADFFAGGKALTVGDQADGPDGVVGKGSINAEPYATSVSTLLDDVYTLTPPTEPGTEIQTLVQVGNVSAEVLKWIGPDLVTQGTGVFASAGNVIDDPTNAFAGVQVGDVLLIQSVNEPDTGSMNPTGNRFATAVVSVVAANQLTFSKVNAPHASITAFYVDASTYHYTIIRPNAVQLFAVPGSGPTGEEQTFLTVIPGSALHSTVGPTLNAINIDRLTNLALSSYSGSTSRDRADAVYPYPAPGFNGEGLGYRVVLYPDDGSGSAPDLSNPIPTLNPVIDPAIPAADQRMTLDYKAGVVRFSCAPKLGGQIKVAGGVNATTGRLNLYAVFFCVDSSAWQGAARGLYEVRTDVVSRPPAKVYYNSTTDSWNVTTNNAGREFYAETLETSEDYRNRVTFGLRNPDVLDTYRYFTYDPTSETWRFKSKGVPDASDTRASMEMVVADKTMLTVGDISAPPKSPADVTPALVGVSPRGARNTNLALTNTVRSSIMEGNYGVIHLRRGKYNLTETLYVPPGVILEGEGDGTVIEYSPVLLADSSIDLGTASSRPAIKFGPNNRYGTYDASYTAAGGFSPTTLDTSVSNHIEGMDIVWNSVRRVWAIFWADTTSNAVWYTEVGLDGTDQFYTPLDVKDSVTPLFTATSSARSWHTSGHYPRVAFHEPTDTYAVTWVEETTIGSDLGPVAQSKIIQTDLETRNTIPFSPTQNLTSFTTLASAGLDTSLRFSTHPSVSASKIDGAASQFGFSCWAFEITAVGSYSLPSNSDVVGRLFDGAAYNPIFSAGTGINSAAFISSTDVSADGRGGYLFAWSRHRHPALFGSNSTIKYDYGLLSEKFTGAGQTQPTQVYPSGDTITFDLSGSGFSITDFHAGDTIYVGRKLGTLSLVASADPKTLSRAAGWFTAEPGDWVRIGIPVGDSTWHRIDSIYLANATLSDFTPLPPFAAVGLVEVYPDPINALESGHLVAKYVVTSLVLNVLTCEVLQHLSIPAGTNFGAFEYTIFKVNEAYVEDSAIPDWTTLVDAYGGDPHQEPASTFHRLGRSIESSYYTLYGEGLFGRDFGAYKVGTDYLCTNPERLYVRTWPSGEGPIPYFGLGSFLWQSSGANPTITPYYLLHTLAAPGTGTLVQFGTVLTDATQDFATSGIRADDWLYVFGETLPMQITTVTATTLTITGNVFSRPSGIVSYVVVAGAHSEAWALTSQSFIEGARCYENGTVGSLFKIAGAALPNPYIAGGPYYFGPAYVQSQYEPDYVRLSRGDDRWLAVYQAMRSTAQLASRESTNWEGFTRACDPSLVETKANITVGDRDAIYREHVSTCFAIIEDSTESVLAPSDVTQNLKPNTSNFYSDAIRDINVSNRSLGVSEPVIRRVNYYALAKTPGAAGFGFRSGHTYNNEISGLNHLHRYTSTKFPSLLPAVTWSGEDWTVVSPTKRVIQSFTGVYEVDGAGDVVLRDATFMFGDDAEALNGSVQRRTTEGELWFPSASASATISAVVDEHSVVLSGNPLGLPVSTTTTNVNWAVIGSGPDHIVGAAGGGGTKNLGFRVSLEGDIIVSSSYNTFADEPLESENINPAYVTGERIPRRQQTLLKEGLATSQFVYEPNSSSVLLQPRLTFSQQEHLAGFSTGQNAPSMSTLDGFEESGRYVTNVGFQGVAPGESMYLDQYSLDQDPFVSVAWGENLYGFATHATFNGLKQVRVYRQSFGPYNNGLRNLKLVNLRPASQAALGSDKYLNTHILTREWVYTRFGWPLASTHRFATDGYRNVWAYAAPWRTFTNIDAGNPGKAYTNLHYVYTDALGRSAIHMDGPEPLQATVGLQDPFPSEVPRLVGPPTTSKSAGWYGVSSPKVIWDGNRYVVAWIENGGHSISNISPILCLAFAPGGEDAGVQTNELGTVANPDDLNFMADYTRLPKIQMAITIDAGLSTTDLAIFDIAYSGNTYAVLWVSGLDTNQLASGVSTNGAIVGVTIVDQPAPGGSGLDFDGVSVTSGWGNSSGTVEDMSFTIQNIAGFTTYTTTGAGVSVGDILVVSEDPNLGSGSNSAGAYYIRAVATNTLTLDRSIPKSQTTTGLQFMVKRPSRPAGGKSYVLGSTPVGVELGVNRWRPYRNPKILWNGHEYVALWVGDTGAAGGSVGGQLYLAEVLRDAFYTLSIPEHGPSAGILTPYASNAGGLYSNVPGAGYGGLGITLLNSALPRTLLLGLTSQVIDQGPATVTVVPVGFDGQATVIRSVAGFMTQGVRPGDILFGADAGATGYQYVLMVENVDSDTQLTTSSILSGVPSAAAGRAFYILKRAPIPKSKVGDTVKVYSTSYISGSSTTSVKGAGVYSVSIQDTFRGVVTLGNSVAAFTSTLAYPWGVNYLPWVIGELQSGGTSDANFHTGNSNTYNSGPVLNARGFLPHSASKLTAEYEVPQQYAPHAILSVVYNDVDDEYAVLWLGRYQYGASESLALHISFFSAGFESHLKTENLYAGYQGYWPVVGDLAWNGTEYLLIYTKWNQSLLSDADLALYYRTIKKRVLGAESRLGYVSDFLTWSGVPQAANQEGPPDFSLPPTQKLLPSFSGVQILWNGVLGRWAVSVSVNWIRHDNSASDSSGLTDSLNPLISLDNTVIDALPSGGVERWITLNSGADWEFIQPGARLIFTDGLTSTPPQDITGTVVIEDIDRSVNQIKINGHPELIDNLLLGGLHQTGLGNLYDNGMGDKYLQTTFPAGSFSGFITVGDRVLLSGTDVGYVKSIIAADIVELDITTGFSSGLVYDISRYMHVVPREDMFCVTLGSRFPTVVFEDADGSFLENVTVSGASTIEEKYTNMARPIWQSGGMVVGHWFGLLRDVYTPTTLARNDNLLGVHKPPGYNHRFLVPWNKVALPRYTNVKQVGRNKINTQMLGVTATRKIPRRG